MKERVQNLMFDAFLIALFVGVPVGAFVFLLSLSIEIDRIFSALQQF